MCVCVCVLELKNEERLSQTAPAEVGNMHTKGKNITKLAV